MLPEEKHKDWKPKIEFESEMQKKLRDIFGLDVAFHYKDGQKPFGYSLIDHKTETVYKGNDIIKMNELFELTDDRIDKKLFESLKDYNITDNALKKILMEYLKRTNAEAILKDFMLFETKSRKIKKIFESVKNEVRDYLKNQNSKDLHLIKSEDGKYYVVHSKLKKTLDIPKGVVVLTTIGFNIRIKGFDILVKSIQSLMDSNRLKNDIIVLVIGISENSEDSNSLRQLIAEAGLNRKIMSLGIRNDINDILNISDIYLQPSRTEGLSLSIMEALNYSLPVIGTRVGGIPEIVHEGENGYLFEKENVEELADRIEILVNNREVREMMGRKSKVISSRFTLADGVEKLASIYHQTN
jgi:glycosyltransferase involved in cell wall biosynthesis